jgi:ATP-dependent protease HslVU (ClpYQ) ATPase subunit
MGKGSKKRKCQVSREVEEANWRAIFGEKKLNIMSNKDREEMWRSAIEEVEKPYFDRLDEIDKIIKEGETNRQEKV